MVTRGRVALDTITLEKEAIQAVTIDYQLLYNHAKVCNDSYAQRLTITGPVLTRTVTTQRLCASPAACLSKAPGGVLQSSTVISRSHASV